MVHVHALSFLFPQKDAMEQIANDWHEKVQSVWQNDNKEEQFLFLPNYIQPEDYLVNIDDDDDYDNDNMDDDMDDDMMMTAAIYNDISTTMGQMRQTDMTTTILSLSSSTLPDKLSPFKNKKETQEQ